MSRLSTLALADARFPGGGHVHSGGVEEAVARGWVADVASLHRFLRGRLRGAGELQATFAAAATHATLRSVPVEHWRALDAELDARTPSPAQRIASRAQGRAAVRSGRAAWPSTALEDLVTAATHRPHHSIVVGVLAATGGAGPRDAALTVGYLTISGPSSAGVRLLGLDPIAVNASVAELSTELDALADRAAEAAGAAPAELPGPGAPALDVLAEAHDRRHRDEVRLFAS